MLEGPVRIGAHVVFQRASSSGFGGGVSGIPGPPPRDLVILLVVVFVTYSMQFFGGLRLVPALLHLTPAVLGGFVWQVATYPFAGFGAPSFWFLLELLVLYWFGVEVFWRLGRRRFWRLLVTSAVVAGLAAVLVQGLAWLATGGVPSSAFTIMQGQRMLLAVVIAAFATMVGEATILLFFVLPVKARWFLWIEVALAFIAYLGSKDLAGFAGVCVAVWVTWLQLQPGGPGSGFRRLQLDLRRRIVEWRLRRLRRRRRFDVIDGGDGRDRDRWVH